MTMHMKSWSTRQSGFSLIEAMIAVVVLATGLLALTALQGSLIRNSADAKARSIIATYAEGEMDRLRAGGVTAIATATTNATPNGTDSLSLAQSASGVTNLSQGITATEYHDNGSGAFVAGSPTGTEASFKQVQLVLSWKDASNANRRLEFETVISPLSLKTNNVLFEREPPDDTDLQPIVRRTSPVTEGMIPIAMGDGQDTAATNPKPELVGRQNDTLVSDTRFEVLTYDPTDNLSTSGFVRFNKRIETAMVGCKCQTGDSGFPTGGSSPAVNSLLKAYSYRPSYWDGDQYSEPEIASYGVNAPAGSPVTSVTQSELCDVCCRDHRDPSGSTAPLFAPELTTHDHYLDITGSAVSSGQYYEACRVIRVNGVWRVTPDPVVQDVSLLATQNYPSTTGSSTAPADNDRATSPLVADSAKNAYVTYAYDFIKTYFYDGTTGFDRHAMQATDGLDTPDYVPIKSGDTRWLHARSFLIDHLEQDALDALSTAKADCTGSTTAELAKCELPHVPLAAVNVTELAKWGGKETSDTGITLSGSLATATVNYGQASLRAYVSQLAGTSAINPTDDASAVKDEQTFALVPPDTSIGAWLYMPNTTDSVFGDPTNPIRGYASYEAIVYNFGVTLSGIAATSDRNIISPSVAVGTADCNPNSTSNANPYACSSSTGTSVTLGFSDYNRMADSTTNVNICGKNQKKKVCLTYSFNGLTVDGVSTTTTYSVVSGSGTPAEVSTLGPFSVKSSSDTGYPSTVVVNFNQSSTDATYTCPASGTGTASWTCP